MFSAICELIAPAGGPLHENLARDAITEALEQLYEKLILAADSTDLSALNQLTAGDVKNAVETAIAAYIYNRWLLELGVKIEQHAVTPEQAVKLERDMKVYVSDAVKLDFANVDILTVDWQGTSGSELLENLFQEAYGILEVE